MNFQKSSRAGVVISVLAAIAPMFTNLAVADDTSRALTVDDAEVANSVPSGSVSGSATATAESTAGIGFVPGDLVLYQVPNFDFGKNHKFAATLSDGNGIGLVAATSASGSTKGTRGVVILDNRSSNNNSPVNWKLYAKATAFATGSAQLSTSQLKLRPKLATAIQPNPLTTTSPYTIDESAPGNIAVDINKNGGVVVEANSIHNSQNVPIASSGLRYTPKGALALSFIEPTYVGFYVGQSDIRNIKSDSVYTSDLTWTLSTDATNNS